MFGAVTKTYYAEKMGLDPKDIVCVSVMPCTAKKFEIREMIRTPQVFRTWISYYYKRAGTADP